METRAPYVLIGLFMVAVIVAVFGFVYWLNNTAALQQRTTYRIQFENTVSGLLTGAAVLFNGIRVGEVTELQLNPANPQEVIATVAVASDTPVRPDTHVGLEFQGLTGVPVIALQGGKSTQAEWPAGAPRVLVADPAAGQSMTQVARSALQRVDTILADNAEPVRSTIANLNTFTAALARNSGRIDGIITALERMTGAGVQEVKSIYDLAAPRTFPTFSKALHVQLVIPDPTIVVGLDTQKFIVRQNGSATVAFPNAQWSDSVPKLVQAKIIQAFENANFLQAVARPTEGLTADYQLLLDIRSFQILISAGSVADIEFTAKILGNDGRVVGRQMFHATAPTKAADATEAAAAFDEAFRKAASELVIWTSERI